MEDTIIELIMFDESNFQKETFQTIEDALKKVEETTLVCWLNIDGLHDTTIVEFLVNEARLHKLSGEDILNTRQRPKLDDYDTYIQIAANMFMIADQKIEQEQITLLIYDRLLISYQEKSGDVFDGVRNRISTSSGFIRKRGADYLGYALLDSIVDQYYVILEHQIAEIEEVEENLLIDPTENILPKLHTLRRRAMNIRRGIFPMREIVNQFQKTENKLVQHETKLFIRDLYDHTIQVIETTETFRESVNGSLDLYMNMLSNRMNSVMKVLTIVSTIFIPLTFISGFYGMNFINMPELKTEYGYPIIISIMVVVTLAMIIYFKRKKWL
jgi:magnesium transporter